jgi:hypothetical protein
MYYSNDVADFAVDFTVIHILPSICCIYSTSNPKSTGNFPKHFFN